MIGNSNNTFIRSCRSIPKRASKTSSAKKEITKKASLRTLSEENNNFAALTLSPFSPAGPSWPGRPCDKLNLNVR